MHIFHKWEKQPITYQQGLRGVLAARQCKKCGLKQIQKLFDDIKFWVTLK